MCHEKIWLFFIILLASVIMGVDHGGGTRGTSPQTLDAKANCPPQISSYRYKNERSVAFKTPKSVFGRGSAPDPLGELTTLPQIP